MSQTTDAAPTGRNLVAGADSAQGTATFPAVDPLTGQPHPVDFHEATTEEVASAAEAAAEAFAVTRRVPRDRLSGLLRGVAAGLEDLGDRLLAVADEETGLGAPRLTGERARTCAQLRAFADLLDDGWYLEAIIDTAKPDAEPVPIPDLRRLQVPLGPVAVFGASNFPLAFSVPGGDTAAALAAGCPVVAKAHPSHPGTSELAGRVMQAAVASAGLPGGMFSLLQGQGADVGRALVTAPQVAAVGFTGSHDVGRALYDLAASRPRPIPVYAEMGSVNPVFVTTAALRARAETIADGFVGSMTMGVGQFCTKPGLLFVPDDDAGAAFVEQVADRLRGYQPGPLLNGRIRDALSARLDQTTALPGVQTVAVARPSGDGVRHEAVLLSTDWPTFRDTPQLAQEHFGPVSVVVRCPADAMPTAAAALEGQLTATVHAEEPDHDTTGPLLSVLRERAGRLIYNGFPTGVAVTAAMHHGGPYPATTVPAHTSVGGTAIRRFLRPVCYQNTPPALLPDALLDHNPLGLLRLVDGVWTDAPVGG